MWSRSSLVLRDNDRRNQHHYRDKTVLPQNISIDPNSVDPKIHRQLLEVSRFHPATTAQTCKPAANEIVPITFGGPIDN